MDLGGAAGLQQYERGDVTPRTERRNDDPDSCIDRGQVSQKSNLFANNNPVGSYSSADVVVVNCDTRTIIKLTHAGQDNQLWEGMGHFIRMGPGYSAF